MSDKTNLEQKLIGMVVRAFERAKIEDIVYTPRSNCENQDTRSHSCEGTFEIKNRAYLFQLHGWVSHGTNIANESETSDCADLLIYQAKKLVFIKKDDAFRCSYRSLYNTLKSKFDARNDEHRARCEAKHSKDYIKRLRGLARDLEEGK